MERKEIIEVNTNIESRQCACCDEKAYIQLRVGERIGGFEQTQSIVLCAKHLNMLLERIPV